MTRLTDTYRRIMQRFGRRIAIERGIGNGDPFRQENVRARVRGATSEEIAGGIDATEHRVLILAEDVPAAALPLLEGDRLDVGGRMLTFRQRPDDQTHRDGEKLLAIEGFAS